METQVFEWFYLKYSFVYVYLDKELATENMFELDNQGQGR